MSHTFYFRRIDIGAPDDFDLSSPGFDLYDFTSIFEDDPELLAESAAQTYMDNHDGWEDSWPVCFEVFKAAPESDDDEDEEPDPISVGRFKVSCEMAQDERHYGVTVFDPKEEPNRLKALEVRRADAEKKAEGFKVTLRAEGKDTEVWKCRHETEWGHWFDLIITPYGFAVVGDVLPNFLGDAGYGIQWFSSTTPCVHGKGYMRSKIRAGLNREDPDADFFTLMLLHYVAKKIYAVKFPEEEAA